jgi:small conductance mechanosensitive channel
VSKRQVAVELAAGAGAIAALVIGYHYGGQTHELPSLTRSAEEVAHSNHVHSVIAYSATAVWLVLGSYTVRNLVNRLSRVVAVADTATAASLRLILTIVGMVLVLLLGLSMLRIGVAQLLVGGAITGIVLGIAAQQSLGNLFAGIMLLVARPFRAGDHIRVRAGSLGSPVEGHVVSMGLVYVVFATDEGTILVPNLTLLASGIVRSPRPTPPPSPVVVVGTPAEGTDGAGARTAPPPAEPSVPTAPPVVAPAASLPPSSRPETSGES